MNDQPKSQMLSFTVPGVNYGYTGAQISALQTFENTLAVGLFDESGSTTPFAKQMEGCVKEIVKSLRVCPRASNLIYAHYHFDTGFREVHGFKPLIECNEGDYDGCWAGGGQTHLYDSEDRVINFILDYAKRQADLHYSCNGALYILTDGCDFGSTLTQNAPKLSLANALVGESLESLFTLMIGVNPDKDIQEALQRHAAFVGFTDYIAIEKADAATLAKIAWHVSQQVSAQSQSLGSGGPSKPLKF